jgi:hypothetical protein
MATHWTLGCDAVEPQRLAAFWALALGYVSEPGYDAVSYTHLTLPTN